MYLGIPTDLLDVAGRRGARSRRGVAARRSCGAGSDGDVPPRRRGCSVRRASPLIWAGGGAIRAGAGPAVAALAERLGAPVITTYAGRGLLAPEHPCAVPGPVHHPAVGALWDRADVVVAIGSDLDGMMTQNWAMPAPPALVAINVDAADASKNYPATVVIEADARAGTEALCAGCRATEPDAAGWCGLQSRAWPRPGGGGRERGGRRASGRGVAVRALTACSTPRPWSCATCASPGYWIAGFRRVPAPRRLAYPMGWGTLGFAFPASLGAALAGPGRWSA